MPKSDKLLAMLEHLSEPYRAQALHLYDKYNTDFRSVPSSKDYHGAYVGGNYDHTFDVMKNCNVVYSFYLAFCKENNLPIKFSKDKLIFAAFLHDFGKIYQMTKKPYIHHTVWIFEILKSENIKIDNDVATALRMHHGGYGDRAGEPNEMSILLHCIDMLASRFLEVK
ncbi:HD domain-containing protein [Sulfuricurvum sp.]|uniref:HD domain-containing protein n=1 Tax=Sulfuricurvum sp. TaxID=2025608 RepID=UPI003564F6C3